MDVLAPLPYHLQLRDYLKAHEAALWRWFASAEADADYTQQVRLELLKATYRLGRDDHAELYALLDAATGALALPIPVTLYQAQQASEGNAALYYTPGEGHIVVQGSLLTALAPAELKALFGHELAHFAFWHGFDGDFLIADRVICAMANDLRADASHLESARRYHLYAEIYADRGALRVAGDLHTTVAALVKASTGLATVSPASYLQQAEEILAHPTLTTEGLTHPELFFRARALALAAPLLCPTGADAPHTPDAPDDLAAVDAAIQRLLDGPPTLDGLDLLGQQRCTALTRRLLASLLAAAPLRSDAVFAHARLFFADFAPEECGRADPTLAGDLAALDPTLQDYCGYLLLDCATLDPDLADEALAATLQWAARMGLAARYEPLVVKELKTPKRTLARLRGG
jgi:hypothetical protein